MTKDPSFHQSKTLTLNNLETLQANLVEYTEEGMSDFEDAYYNELLGLIEDAHIVKTWDELMELVARAKTLELDMATWLSMHGRTSISLSWPKPGSSL